MEMHMSLCTAGLIFVLRAFNNGTVQNIFVLFLHLQGSTCTQMADPDIIYFWPSSQE